MSDLPPALPGLEPPVDPRLQSVPDVTGSETSRPVRAPRRRANPDAGARKGAAARSTAASRRVGGDHPTWFVLQIVGLIGVILSALTISATALIVVGGWQQTPDAIDPLTVTMIDLPMLVAFFCGITFKWRGYVGWLWGARLFGGAMTGFSAAANFLYTVSATAAITGGTGLETYQEVTGAIVHAAAPVLVNVCFEFFGQIITRPKRNAVRLRKMTVRELQRVEKELAKRIREADRAEMKALRG